MGDPTRVSLLEPHVLRDMLATISTVPPDSIILALVVSRDVTGEKLHICGSRQTA